MRKLSGRSIHELMRDYLKASECVEALEVNAALAERLKAYRRFIEREGHRIGRFPGALLPVALAEPMDSLVRKNAMQLIFGSEEPLAPGPSRQLSGHLSTPTLPHPHTP